MGLSDPKPGLARDLAASARVWRADPRLPALTLLVFTGSFLLQDLVLLADGFHGMCLSRPSSCPGARGLAGLVGLLQIPFLLFACGWVGTERIWYLRAFRGKRMSITDAIHLTRRFFSRYFVLGAIFSAITLPILSISLLWASGVSYSLWLIFGVSAVIDVLLTFVTPALAYTTPSVRSAFRIGVHLLRASWPSSAPYALIPPLAVYAVTRIAPTPAAVAPALIAGSALLSLWFKGAIAAFYLRNVVVAGQDGAANLRTIPAPSGIGASGL